MRVCIQYVEDTMKGLNERKQICGVLVLRAITSHSNAEDRANYLIIYPLMFLYPGLDFSSLES